MNFLWGRQAAPEPDVSGAAAAAPTSAPPLVLLAIAADKQAENWAAVMKGCDVGGRAISVVQCSWKDLQTSSEPMAYYRPSTLMVHVAGHKGKAVRPDLVLIRNEVFTPQEDYRNQLYGLMTGGVPSINSLHSVFCFCEKAVVNA